MADEQRVQQLLDEVLDSERTPEEVCRACPELLAEVHRRWRQIRHVEAKLGALFPGPTPTPSTGPPAPLYQVANLPRIPGYEVEAVLGRGGMGVVFQARHLKLKRLVALKMLLAGAYAGPLELERFRREAEAVAALRHPHIVQVYDVGEVVTQPFFTMEFVDGGSLAQQLSKTRPDARQTAELVATLASAVQFAHKSGIIHRDLKPANILIAADGTPKIADFRLARPIHGGAACTRSGTRLGTPSYMAPEQVLGQTSAIGPSVDIYALGAVLYESLTGRPPFVGDSAAETEQKVIAEEPTPPSRWNAKIPRDLETICLKCLQKGPARRYASAQDLADDLHRFLDGKPVLARPVGIAQRAVKWTRRRPALATLSAAMVVVLGTAIGISIWLHRQESSRQIEGAHRQASARAAIEAAIERACESGRRERWQEARLILADATGHLANANSDPLRLRIARAEADLHFAQKLGHIRQNAASSVMERLHRPKDHFLLLATEYDKAFAQEGISINADAEETAARVRASPLHELMMAALDEWALAAFLLQREPLRRQLLDIARRVDTESAWHQRFGDLAAWRDKKLLRQLATEASTAPRPTAAHQLAIMATLLANLGAKSEGRDLLREALRRRPSDFWLNWEMGSAYGRDNKHKESVPYFRIVIALRPDNPWTTNRLACALIWAGAFDEGVAQFRRAIELEPNQPILHRNLAIALSNAGRSSEAIEECRRQTDADPANADAAFTLGLAFSLADRHEDSIPWYQKAIDLNPKGTRAHYNLGVALGVTGRTEQAALAFRKTLDLEPGSVLAHHGLCKVLQKLGRHTEAIAEFEWLLCELDPKKMRADADLGDSLDSKYIFARHRITDSLLCLGRFADTAAAAQKALELPEGIARGHEELRHKLALAKQLQPIEAQLPAILAGNELPADAAMLRTLAEWCYKHGRLPATSVRLYDIAFRKQPALADDLNAKHRYYSACAAAFAGCGFGEDSARLDDQARAALRKRALSWLRADCAAWVKRHEDGKASDQSQAAQAVRAWQRCDDLAGVRDPAGMAALPAKEREVWQHLWADVKALASHDPLLTLEQARTHVARKHWGKAAEIYAQLLEDTPTNDGEIWFEYAAAQLLSGDRQGYRRTCQRLLEGGPKALKIRAYLVARTCTLAPDSVDDALLPGQVSAEELKQFATAFWSLTEQGALRYRANQFKEAVPLLERSLRAETKPGAAVLNWLWLALTYQKLGDEDEAERWLMKAQVWLDSLGTEMPANAAALNLHQHNWLEAHILRHEAEMLLSVPAKRGP